MTGNMKDPRITFWTAAPGYAPEVKGHSCYFRPERLEWIVTPRDNIRVVAHGPATRVDHRQGSMSWSVSGRWGDERPNWLLLPIDPLATAQLAVDRLAKEAS